MTYPVSGKIELWGTYSGRYSFSIPVAIYNVLIYIGPLMT